MKVSGFNTIEDYAAKRPPPISFSPVTSTNVRISPENFMMYSFKTFLPYWCKILRPHLNCSHVFYEKDAMTIL